MEQIRFLCSMWQTPKSLMYHAWSICLVVASVSCFEMIESTELKGIWHPSAHGRQFHFFLRRNSFQSCYLWEKSSFIKLVRRMKIVTPILKNCLIICERFKSRILCFELNAVENDTMSSRRFSKRQRRKLLTPRSRLVRKKKRKKGKIQGRKSKTLYIYIAADMHTSWKKVKRMCF